MASERRGHVAGLVTKVVVKRAKGAQRLEQNLLIFFRHRFIERALTAGLREEFCDRPLEVRLDLPNPLGLAVEGRGRVKIGIVIELNERLESNAKPATVIENCMMVVRDPPRPRIEIKAVVEHAVLRGAAEFSVGIATPNRPVSPSGTGIVLGGCEFFRSLNSLYYMG